MNKRFLWKLIPQFMASVMMLSGVGSYIPGNHVIAAESQESHREDKIRDVEEERKELEKLVSSLPYFDPGPVAPILSRKGKLLLQADTLPAKYDARDKGYITSVKNQGDYGICWAYGTINAVEASSIKKGLTTLENTDFSEYHLAYYTFRSVTDPLGGTEGDINYRDTVDKILKEGSNIRRAKNTLISWAGVARETDAPISSAPSELPDTVEGAYGKNAVIVTDVREINSGDKKAVKEALMQYGSLGMSYHSVTTPNYYNATTGAQYVNTELDTNHAVSLVGWDDNYSRENFGNIKPKANGAWLFKNTWGEGLGDKGYFWLSYEDQTLHETMYAFDVASPDTYDHNYQYDGAGLDDWSLEKNDELVVANVFTAKGNPDGQEVLEAVSFDIETAEVGYSIQIYKNLENPSDPTSGTAVLDTPVTGSTTHAGYYTIDLKQDIILEQDDTFAVVITFTKSGSAIKMVTEYGGWSEFDLVEDTAASIEPKQSFYKNGSSWKDIYGDIIVSYNLRIKAFTSNVTSGGESPDTNPGSGEETPNQDSGNGENPPTETPDSASGGETPSPETPVPDTGDNGGTEVSANDEFTAPTIQGYTLVKNEGEPASYSISDSKEYIIVSQGADKSVYAVYPNERGLDMPHGSLRETSVVTARLNIEDNKITEVMALGDNRQITMEELHLQFIKGSQDGSYKIRGKGGYYLNLGPQYSPYFLTTFYDYPARMMGMNEKGEAEIGRYGSYDGAYNYRLRFNVNGEESVNGKINEKAQSPTGFFIEASREPVVLGDSPYPIYIYEKDGSNLTDSRDISGLEACMEKAEEILGDDIYEIGDAWHLLEDNMPRAEEMRKSPATYTQIEIDAVVYNCHGLIESIRLRSPSIDISGDVTKIYDGKTINYENIELEAYTVEGLMPVFFEPVDGEIVSIAPPTGAGKYLLYFVGWPIEPYDNDDVAMSNGITFDILKAPISIKDVSLDGGLLENVLADMSSRKTEAETELPAELVEEVIFAGLVNNESLQTGRDYTVTVKGKEIPGTDAADTSGKLEITVSVSLNFTETAANYNLETAVFNKRIPLDGSGTDHDEPVNPGVSGNDPETPGENPGVSGNDPETPGENPGVSENNPETPGDKPGVSDNDTVTTYKGIWVEGLEDKEYTGSKITQKLKVYDGDRLLVENADYTISYRNNVNAYEFTDEELEAFEKEYSNNPKTKANIGELSNKKVPQVVLKMKGNYTGTRSLFFRIKKQNIEDEDEFILDDIMTVSNTGKKKTPVPVITWKVNGRNLKNKKDFTVEEISDGNNLILKVEGQKNFTGKRTITVTMNSDKNVITMDQVKVSKVKPVDYKPGESLQPQGYRVTYKNMTLEEGTHFTVSDVSANDITGAATASFVMTAKEGARLGEYQLAGSRRVFFKVNTYSMSRLKTDKIEKQVFSGYDIEPLSGIKEGSVHLVIPGKGNLPERSLKPDDYNVTYEKNVVKGTASVILEGKPEKGITGIKKLTFKIDRVPLTNTSDGMFKVNLASDVSGNDNTVYYQKSGARPVVTIERKEDGQMLVEGRDYTVTYKKAKGTDIHSALVRGKGNYTGSFTLEYKVIQKPVTEEEANGVWIQVNDKVMGSKKNSWKQSFKILDSDGKALVNNQDAKIKEARYYIHSLPLGFEDDRLKVGEELTDSSTVLPEKAEVRVEVTLMGNYTGTVKGIYRIINKDKDISKAKIKIKPQQYTSEAIVIDSDDDFDKLSLKNHILSIQEGEGQTVEAVSESYINNVKKGTARVTFRGVGEFGGIKTVTFKIGARNIEDCFSRDFHYWK